MSANVSYKSAQLKTPFSPAQSAGAVPLSNEFYETGTLATETQTAQKGRGGLIDFLIAGLKRRLVRERRRRKVGRAYDMAREIAQNIPKGSEVLDIGCGNGFIAHNLSAMLGTGVVGIDVAESTEALIDYRPYDGVQFPVEDGSKDAVLLCYVLHHAQDLSALLNEMKRVLKDGGLAIIYEDIPRTGWDKGVCWIHNLQWKNRTGPCVFRSESEWRQLFRSFGFEVTNERRLSRWRNFTHPVRRRIYLLRSRPAPATAAGSHPHTTIGIRQCDHAAPN
jgi:SAM-dependent methyltransferase